MNVIALNTILTETHNLPLVIESLEGGTYIALTGSDGERKPLTDDSGRWLKNHNLAHMRERLAPYDWASVTLVQNTPYDEMIGNPSEPDAALRIPLDWQRPDRITPR